MADLGIDFGDEDLGDEDEDEDEDQPEPPVRCGGSVIDDQHIVTAAHCVGKEGNSAIDPSLIKVYLGRHKKPELQSEGALSVAEVVIHPEYRFEAYSHDIAILKLAEKIDFDRTVAPICLLARDRNLLETSKKFIVAGWGFLGPGQEEAYKLQEGEVEYIDCEFLSILGSCVNFVSVFR